MYVGGLAFQRFVVYLLDNIFYENFDKIPRFMGLEEGLSSKKQGATVGFSVFNVYLCRDIRLFTFVFSK